MKKKEEQAMTRPELIDYISRLKAMIRSLQSINLRFESRVKELERQNEELRKMIRRIGE